MIISDEYICHADNFYMQPAAREECINYLINSCDDHCDYKHFEGKFYVKFLDKIYVYTKDKEQAVVKCNDKKWG